jgi:hypothetical protein
VLAQTKPKHAGIVFRCAACNEPRFLRGRACDRADTMTPRTWSVDAPEAAQYAHLPDGIEQLLRETLDCYSLGAHQAFATMCRRTTRTALRSLDTAAQDRWQDRRRSAGA